ncbi:TlpA family protein disulfide reductase [Chryseobacterium defluvii]|uniref:Peroxiredoxin n=1 Tax=Chryseobacterium defluvii TaxID=160396 RepID=A0A495SNZ4_9FLAO|nr:TlpA disulfide reductase family protein [Chryseobacterium defluvii]RKT01757.1 peroxiredoxin [Chryseobacterium defluvii]
MKKFIIVIVLNTLALLSFAQQDSIIISGSFQHLRSEDSIILEVKKYYDVGDKNSEEVIIVKPKAGSFSFKIAGQNHPQFINLIMPGGYQDIIANNLSLYGYLVENGDQIYYSDKYKDRFIGPGSEKWKILTRLRSIDVPYEKQRRQVKDSDLKSLFNVYDSSYIAKLEYISENEKMLSHNVYTLMKADIVSSNIIGKQFYIRQIERSNPAALNELAKSSITDSLFNSLANDTSMFYSIDFIGAVISNYHTKQSLSNRIFDVKDCYNFLLNTYPSNLGERAIVSLFLRYMQRNNITPLLKDAVSKVKDRNLNTIILRLVSGRGEGSEAYNFQLPDAKGKIVRLSDFKGKTVVLDFWYTGCIGCAALAPYMKKIEEKFQGKDVVFITISVDKNKDKWLKSLKQKIYSSSYTIDLNTESESKNHPVIKNYMIRSYPTLITIDKDGKIMRQVEDPRGDNGGDLISLLNFSLQ